MEPLARALFTLAILLLRAMTLVLAAVARLLGALVGANASETTPRDEHAAAASTLSDEEMRAIEIPERIRASTSDPARQLEKLRAYEAWRREFDVDNALRTKKPYFALIKRLYPHAFHGTGKARSGGATVQLEKAGQFGTMLRSVREASEALGRFEDDPIRVVVEHVSFVMTYVFERVDTRPWPLGKTIRIVDLSRMGMDDLALDVFEFLKAMSDMSKVAFVERVHKIYVLHPPAAFAILFAAFKPLFSEKTLKQIVVCRTIEDFTSAVKSEIDLRDVPREYGGSCECKDCWRDCAREKELWELARELNGESM